MKITHSITTAMLMFTLNCCLSPRPSEGRGLDACAQKNQQQTPETKQTIIKTPQKRTKSKPGMDFVKMVNFYMRSGELVFGKLVSEDKNKITVEQLDGSRIIVATYSKREIDTRTVHTRNVRISRHYMELAEYFAGRTWDFRDDPDDFIQAIRCYEKARHAAAQTQRQNNEKIEQINQSLEQLQADRQVWIREVESRAKLKKLEFETEIEKRLNELENTVNESSRLINKTTTEMKDSYQKIRKTVAAMNKDVYRQLDILENRIEADREMIDRIYYYTRWRPYPPYYHHNRRKSKPDDEK